MPRRRNAAQAAPIGRGADVGHTSVVPTSVADVEFRDIALESAEPPSLGAGIRAPPLVGAGASLDEFDTDSDSASDGSDASYRSVSGRLLTKLLEKTSEKKDALMRDLDDILTGGRAYSSAAQILSNHPWLRIWPLEASSLGLPNASGKLPRSTAAIINQLIADKFDRSNEAEARMFINPIVATLVASPSVDAYPKRLSYRVEYQLPLVSANSSDDEVNPQELEYEREVSDDSSDEYFDRPKIKRQRVAEREESRTGPTPTLSTEDTRLGTEATNLAEAAMAVASRSRTDRAELRVEVATATVSATATAAAESRKIARLLRGPADYVIFKDSHDRIPIKVGIIEAKSALKYEERISTVQLQLQLFACMHDIIGETGEGEWVEFMWGMLTDGAAYKLVILDHFASYYEAELKSPAHAFHVMRFLTSDKGSTAVSAKLAQLTLQRLYQLR